MSILDDENILIDNAKETSNNPFLTLNEYLKDFDMEGFMEIDKGLVKRILSQLNFPVLYEYKFKFEFKTDCIKLNLLNSNDKFVCTVLFIKKYFHWNTKGIYLYFNIFTDFGNRLHEYGKECIIIKDFLNNILKKYNFDISNKLIFKQ
jgi:hypothetical protein